MDKDRTAEVVHVESATVSRRSILRGVAHAGGAATLLAVIAKRARAAPAQPTKTTKQAAGYQNSPNGGQSCSTCINFVALASAEAATVKAPMRKATASECSRGPARSRRSRPNRPTTSKVDVR
jgi:hypothetical protein